MTTTNIEELEKLFVEACTKVADGGLKDNPETGATLYDSFSTILNELIRRNQSEVIQHSLSKVKECEGYIELLALMDFVSTRVNAETSSGEHLDIRLCALPVVIETSGNAVVIEKTETILDAFYDNGALRENDEIILNGSLVSIEDMPNNYVDRQHVMSELIDEHNPNFKQDNLGKLIKPSTSDFSGSTRGSELRFMLGLLVSTDLSDFDDHFMSLSDDCTFNIEQTIEDELLKCDVNDSVVTALANVEHLDYGLGIQTGYISWARDKIAVAFDKVDEALDPATIEVTPNITLNTEIQAYEFKVTFAQGVTVVLDESFSIPKGVIFDEEDMYEQVHNAFTNTCALYGYNLVEPKT